MRGRRRSRRDDGDVGLTIDESTIVACTPADALDTLYDPAAIANWFGIRRSGFRSVLASSYGDLVLTRVHEYWGRDEQVYALSACAGCVRIDAYVTFRAVIRTTALSLPAAGTELWIHAEIEPAPGAAEAAVIIRDIARRGLGHFCMEFDTTPGSPA